MLPSPENRKIHLLKTGQHLFATQGFSTVGLSEILKNANVPKGSFYYYFPSKEQFGVEVIDYYIKKYLEHIDVLFNQNHLTAKKRLMNYWQEWINNQCSNDYEGRCLIVKLSSEIADFSEAMRTTLARGTQQVIKKITSVIALGFKDNSIVQFANAETTAQLLYQQWLGASLLSKIQKNDLPFQQAKIFTSSLLKK